MGVRYIVKNDGILTSFGVSRLYDMLIVFPCNSASIGLSNHQTVSVAAVPLTYEIGTSCTFRIHGIY